MTDGNLFAQRFHPLPWRECPRCGGRGPRYEFVAGYCRDCAEVLIDNLSATTVANIWKELDAKEAHG